MSSEGVFRKFGLQSTARWNLTAVHTGAGVTWLRLHLSYMMRYPVYEMRLYNDCNDFICGLYFYLFVIFYDICMCFFGDISWTFRCIHPRDAECNKNW